MKNPSLIKLVLEVEDLLKFCWQTEDRKSAYSKVLFRINLNYYMATHELVSNHHLNMLREITATEYKEEKALLLRQKPRPTSKHWQAAGKHYELITHKKYSLRQVLEPENVKFRIQSDERLANNPLWRAYQEALQSPPQNRDKSLTEINQIRKRNVLQTAQLAKELKVAFENIIAIKNANRSWSKEQLIEKLKIFRESYQRAQETVTKLSARKYYLLYEQMKPSSGRTERKKALDTLKIECFNADVKKLNLSELEEQIITLVQQSQDKQIKDLTDRVLCMSYEERERIYDQSKNLHRQKKRDFLKSLGVNTDIIDVNKTSLQEFRQDILSSISSV